MEAICLGILLSIVRHGYALPFTQMAIHPPKALVKLGDSIQLNCSWDCPGAKVQWQGLDTDLGNIFSNHTYSILTMVGVTVDMEDTKFCTGQCQGRSSQKNVDVQVYSFPDTLQVDSQPKTLTPGLPARLFCAMSHVYPPGALTLSWFQGDDRLNGSKEDVQQTGDYDEQLFTYRSELAVPAIAERMTYTCKATLRIGQQMLQVKVATPGSATTQETPNPLESTFTMKAPKTNHTAAPEPSTTAFFAATTSRLPPPLSTTAAPMVEETLTRTRHPRGARNPSTGSASPAQASTEMLTTPQKYPAKEAISEQNPTVTWPSIPETLATHSRELWVTSQDPLSADQPATTNSPATMNSVAKGQNYPKDLCGPVITCVPPQGTTGGKLHITCRATDCGKGVQIQWVETPVDQSQYRWKEAEGWSTLAIDNVSLEHQGFYRCKTVASQSRMTTLWVVVSAATYSTDSVIAIATTGTFLGLIVTSYAAHRIRQRRE